MDSLCGRRGEASSRRRRWRVIVFAGAVLAAAATAPLWQHFTLNRTASLPQGLYALDRGASVSRGDVVSFAVPAAVLPLVVERRYLPAGATLLKKVLALPPDEVCVERGRLLVNRSDVGAVLDKDSGGRPLRAANFCGRLPDGLAFVGSAHPRSLDSRYFGPVPVSQLTRARAVWTY